MSKRRLADMIISAVLASALFGLAALQSGMDWKGALLGSLIIALKDVQSCLSTSPYAPHPESVPAGEAQTGEKNDG